MDLPNRSAEVDEFLARLDHARLAEVQQLRLAILAAEPALTETVKWNAPNFRYAGQDRVTFRLHPRNQVQIVLHRGARVADGPGPVPIPDPDGLLTWLSPDRAVLTLADAEETQSRLGAVTALVGQWIHV